MSETYIQSFDGTRLYLKKEIPPEPKAVLVVVHGRYDYFAEKLIAEGYGIYRFDHRGHGKSDGKRVFYNSKDEIVDDINEVVSLAVKEYPSLKVFLFGHSMGGFAVSLFGAKYPGKVAGIITSGALTTNNSGFGTNLPAELPLDSYIPNTLSDGVCSDPAVVKAYVDDPLVEKEIGVGLMVNLAKGVGWLTENAEKFVEPVLILHGCNDGIVSEKDARDFYGLISSADKELTIYANLFHEILNEPRKDEIIDDIKRWLIKHL